MQDTMSHGAIGVKYCGMLHMFRIIPFGALSSWLNLDSVFLAPLRCLAGVWSMLMKLELIQQLV